MSVPVLEVLQAVEDVEADVPVDYQEIHSLIEHGRAADRAGRYRGLWVRLAAVLRHLQAGRTRAARHLLVRALDAVVRVRPQHAGEDE